jgi:PPP family 3-phenylpropionic acid transporter
MPQGYLVSGLFAAYFFGFGLFLPFFPVVLRDTGLTAAEIGTLLAVPMIVRLAANPLVGGLADRYARPGTAIAVLSGLAALAFAGLFVVSSFWPIAALLLAAALVWSPLVPIEDALAARLDREGRGQYGRMRLWGSVAFIAANLVGGAAAGAHAQAVVIGGIVGGMLVSLAIGLRLTVPQARSSADMEPEAEPERERERAGAAVEKGRGLPDIGFLLVVVGAGVLQGSHAAYYAFSALFWEDAGFSGLSIGILWGLGVTTEIVLFAYAGAVGARIGALGILGIGAAAAILRWLLFPFVVDPLATGLVQLLHGFSFGATHLGAVAFVAARAPRRWAGLSQGLLSMVIGLCTALASALAGALYGIGPTPAFLAMAAIAGVGCAMLAAGALRLRAAATRREG